MEICGRATWAGVVKLKLMARERAGWLSSTSAVVDAMSLLKSDERERFLSVDRSERERNAKNEMKKGARGKKKEDGARGSIGEKSQSRIKGTNKEFTRGKKDDERDGEEN